MLIASAVTAETWVPLGASAAIVFIVCGLVYKFAGDRQSILSKQERLEADLGSKTATLCAAISASEQRLVKAVDELKLEVVDGRRRVDEIADLVLCCPKRNPKGD